MNKDIYRSAMEKIKASDDFKDRVLNSAKLYDTRMSKPVIKRFVPVFAALIAVICIGTALTLFWNNPGDKSNNLASSSGQGSDFKITGSNSDAMACYSSILFMDGYVYGSNSVEWTKHSRYGYSEEILSSVKGDMIGKVTLDLKGKIYTGAPPDFSSTFNYGTKIYEIKGVSKERAVLIEEGKNMLILYRESRNTSENSPINLNVSDVFNMMSDSPKIVSVELRSDYDGSWMRSSEDKSLLELLNRELPGLPLLNSSQLERNLSGENKRIPVNVVFADGRMLNIQVYPDLNYARFFGGYIKLSPGLCEDLQRLFDQGEQYKKISALVPYSESDVLYLYYKNQVNGNEILCKTPKWSRSALFSTLDYYRVKETAVSSDDWLVMTVIMGKSKDDNKTIEFYETNDREIIVKIDGHYYKPAAGKISFDELSNLITNYTDFGNDTGQYIEDSETSDPQDTTVYTAPIDIEQLKDNKIIHMEF